MMSRKLFELLCETKDICIEYQLVLQCAPVLSGLKISNLLIISPKEYRVLCNCLEKLPFACQKLIRTDSKWILLIYRVQELEACLNEDKNKVFLSSLGYPILKQDMQTTISIKEFLAVLCQNYCAYWECRAQFPHELGIFLGYPIEDVSGFMINQGKNDLYSGYWKVYAHLPLKQKLFKKYEEMRELMLRFLSFGLKLEDVIVLVDQKKTYMEVDSL